MYEIDLNDRVIELTEFPSSCSGAPLPVIVSDEQRTLLAYYSQNLLQDKKGTIPTNVNNRRAEPIAMVEFLNCLAQYAGMPNDESLSGHPLYARGLSFYGSFEVLNSSWIRKLERTNSVHQLHNPRSFDSYRHFILTFQDSIFECVAEGFFIESRVSSMREVVFEMSEKLALQ